MKNINIKLFHICFILLSLFCCIAVSASAEDALPFASEYYSEATVSISSSKGISFECITYASCNTIKVSSSSLQKLEGSSWVSVSGYSKQAKLHRVVLIKKCSIALPSSVVVLIV